MPDIIYNDDLLHHIKKNVGEFDRKTIRKKGLTRAAVAITIVSIQKEPEREGLSFPTAKTGHAAMILTRRARHLRNHAGQWALPGGRIDSGESPEETVLRELGEEVGLKLGVEMIIGRLDDYNTRSGFGITPIVVWGGIDPSLTPNPDEVASIHRIPLSEFMREDSPIFQNIPESEQPVLLMPVGNSWIAAPTAAMIFQFREVGLSGHHTRVAQYEQPYFAWR